MDGTVLMEASKQWATRPDDQRYLTLGDLKNAVSLRKDESWTSETPVRQLRVVVEQEKGLKLLTPDRTRGEAVPLTPTHWAFGQLAAYAKAPPPYLRTLPDELAAINLQWGLEHNPIRPGALVLGHTNGAESLRSMTSLSYGRIWDKQVVEAVEQVNADGRWKVPAASYERANPLRATTLYASDRDVFIFLVDPDHPVEVNGEVLFRGFYAWNSEVGSATFGLATFLYRYVCDNRMIWGATDVQELRIRHTRGAPERFGYEGQRYLKRYAEESTEQTVELIKKAQGWELPKTEEKGWEGWLQQRGFTRAQAKDAVDTAKAEEGEARSLWQIMNGVTASARKIEHTDARVQVETAAGNLMKVVR